MQSIEELKMHPQKNQQYNTKKKNLDFYFCTADNEMLLQTIQ